MADYSRKNNKILCKLTSAVNNSSDNTELIEILTEILLQGSSCTTPQYTEVCNLDDIQIGIEAGLAPVGCVKDASGTVVSKVFLCKIVDEATGATTFSYLLANSDGTVVENYSGVWEDCSSECEINTAQGVLTAWG